MAQSTRKAVAPPRKAKPKRKRREDEGAFQDVVALDIPHEVLVGPFRIDIPLDGRRRRSLVVKPKARKSRRARPAPTEDVVTFPVPRKRLFTSFPGELRFDRARRRTPNPVIEPETEAD